ncbi:minor capsid protein [Dyadobacter bucti]|uniref:minor capsid protein n=1 Tax=Dyadobacter bucti TaxID=2572203 RepID=UPI001108D7CA|nr:minor capsid protein [Dyadobacter bucti]
MPTVNERILEAQIKHSVYLERYKGGVLKKIIGLLNDTEADLIELIAARLASIEGRAFNLSPAETKRLEKLLEDIRKKREDVYSVIEKTISGEMNDFSQYEADFQIRLAETAGVQASFTMPSNAQLKAIVTSQPFRGRLLKDWAKGLAQEELQRVQDAIRIGITEGQTTDQIIRRIRGTKKAKYQDGILEISRRDAEAVTRTAVSHVANRARQEVYNANADIVKKLQYVATLDSRTTLICASRDGKVYDLGKEPALPAHFRCRSVLVAYFENDEVGDRASVFGPVPASTTFSEFLKKQSIDFQEEVLGVERAKRFRSGEALEKFVDKTGRTYTLKELKARET